METQDVLWLDKLHICWHNAGMSHSQDIAMTGDSYFVRSYAKINLTLDILGRRSDGYHELATIMQSVDLYDTLCLTATDDQRVHLLCSQAELSNEDNLAARAAQAVRQRLGLTRGLRIELQKRIPVAAGLGGGSSNAASVLLALQRWWRLPLSPEDMQGLAAALGSDVPFFLTAGLALCEGHGERVTLLTARWPSSLRWLLLLKPALPVSTAAVFRSLPASDYTDGHCSRNVCAALQAESPLRLEDLQNGLERGVLAHYAQVAQAREHMLRAGAPFVRLSGSGPTLFAPFAALTEAVQVEQRLRAQGYEVYLTRAIHPTNEDRF